MSKQRRRMAQRYVKRAELNEQGVTISFGFKSFISALFLTGIEEILGAIPITRPLVLVGTLVFFRWHRTVLVTDQHVYVYRDLPFHRPGAMLAMYPLGPGVVTRKRGKLTFADDHVVWHSPFFAWRVKQVAKAIDAGHTAQTDQTMQAA